MSDRPGTRKIVLDKHTLLRICNALNAEAAHFESQAKHGASLPQSTREVLECTAKDNRELTRNLLDQWDKAD